MDIESSARRLGAVCWTETSLFGSLGAAAPRCATAEVKVAVATAARHAAWRAEQLAARLPEAGPFAADLVTVPPAGATEWFEQLDRLDELELLGAVYGVAVPRLVAAMAGWIDRCDGPADASVARTLRIVRDDEVSDWVAAQRVVAAAVTEPGAADRLGAAIAAASTTWVDLGLAGGILQP